MDQIQTILLKITGETFLNTRTGQPDGTYARAIAKQIKQLEGTYRFGIVVGGGNFFRGSQHGRNLGMTPSASHQAGMIATLLNGTILKDLFEQEGVHARMLVAGYCPSIGNLITPDTIAQAKKDNACILFTGGTGNPFFTTDTAAVLRALQIGATQVWKATSVEGIYSSDPKTDPQATFIKHVSYDQALENKLGIIDATAVSLAREHRLPIRIFNLFNENALLTAAQDASYGSLINQNVKA